LKRYLSLVILGVRKGVVAEVTVTGFPLTPLSKGTSWDENKQEVALVSWAAYNLNCVLRV